MLSVVMGGGGGGGGVCGRGTAVWVHKGCDVYVVTIMFGVILGVVISSCHAVTSGSCALRFTHHGISFVERKLKVVH